VTQPHAFIALPWCPGCEAVHYFCPSCAEPLSFGIRPFTEGLQINQPCTDCGLPIVVQLTGTIEPSQDHLSSVRGELEALWRKPAVIAAPPPPKPPVAPPGPGPGLLSLLRPMAPGWDEGLSNEVSRTLRQWRLWLDPNESTGLDNAIAKALDDYTPAIIAAAFRRLFQREPSKHGAITAYTKGQLLAVRTALNAARNELMRTA